MKSLLLCILLGGILIQVQADSSDDLEKEGRITDGHASDENQFPYAVRLVVTVRGGSTRMCGGSLIAPSKVLTAAQCLRDATAIEARLGNRDVTAPATKIMTNVFTMHPQFNPVNMNNDLGIVDLVIDVEMTDRIGLVNLATESDISNSFASWTGRVIGWGSTRTGGQQSQYSRFADVNIITNQRCLNDHAASFIVNSTLCTLGVDSQYQGVCAGDTGGPLVIPDPQGRNKLLAVISFYSSLGCESGRAIGYVRTDHHLGWISSVAGIRIQ